MPQWLKMLIVVIIWDCLRFPIQALITKRFMKGNFEKIEDGLEDVEEALEEDEK